MSQLDHPNIVSFHELGSRTGFEQDERTNEFGGTAPLMAPEQIKYLGATKPAADQ
jgi:hypothetical protein